MADIKILLVAGAIVLALVTFFALHPRVSSNLGIGLVYFLYAISGLMILGAFFVPSSENPSCGYCILMAVVSIIFIYWLIRSKLMIYIVGIAGLIAMFAGVWWLIENAAAANNMIILVIAVGGGIFLIFAVINWLISLFKK
ncbi:MAG: hypothetical protein E7019_06535 [Alphaproteobacteria bacterium]|nr:hypothetical protein [Alphaproteobacteria bacterium]